MPYKIVNYLATLFLCPIEMPIYIYILQKDWFKMICGKISIAQNIKVEWVNSFQI